MTSVDRCYAHHLAVLMPFAERVKKLVSDSLPIHPSDPTQIEMEGVL